MLGSDYKIVLSVKMFTVSDQVIKELEILAMSWLRDTTDYTLLPDQSSFAVHNVPDVSDKEALATDY